MKQLTATESAPTRHSELLQWVSQVVHLCQPDHVYWCNGSSAEYQAMTALLVGLGTFTKLSEHARPNSFFCRSDAGDVARVEDRTFICSRDPEDAGPTNNWRDPQEMHDLLTDLFRGSMKGRTLYVIPYCMGPVGSPMAKVGVELTSSAYVVVNMHLMTCVGSAALDMLGEDGPFVKGLHDVGAPLTHQQADSTWPCNPSTKYIVHFPEDREIWSYGSGYGGNALLGKKCFALRIASVMARDEGWMAEHMLILKITNPQGQIKYVTGAFPSACGKTNLAMLTPTIAGWTVETVGDDIAWLKFGPDGQLYAINPEAGFFGVAPGTSMDSNPNAMRTIEHDAIFTNCALTPDGDVWWEGMNNDTPPLLYDWLRRPWDPDCGRKAAHPNARFTVAAKQCPVIAAEWQKPQGVPISAILFGGRRAGVVPLVNQALSWNHGVFLGATMSSETTAAAAGRTGALRRDPMAMLPFCGYHMGDYFRHWIRMGQQTEPAKLPRIFYVNWFRKDEDGKFLWPGYGENSRILEWIFRRCEEGEAGPSAVHTPIGHLPEPGSLNLQGLDLKPGILEKLLHVDVPGWLAEVPSIAEHFAKFGQRLPKELQDELQALKKRLQK